MFNSIKFEKKTNYQTLNIYIIKNVQKQAISTCIQFERNFYDLQF